MSSLLHRAGFKNSLKGAGYFLGAATVAVSPTLALSILVGLIVLAMPWAAFGLDSQLGRSKGKPVTLQDVFKMQYNINLLSAARIFLFGARCALRPVRSCFRASPFLPKPEICARSRSGLCGY